jgi:citrate lyase subunit beta / citryl-CoA lyase
MPRHPSEAFYRESAPFPALPACEHYAGSEKLIAKAIELQRTLGLSFDVTLDLEDGAPEGREEAHAKMVADVLRACSDRHRRGVRVHGVEHGSFRRDLEVVLDGARDRIAYLTLPKARGVADVQAALQFTGDVPLHVLIETHGALRDAFAIAALPQVEVLDFGLMDFVSAHHGAIPSSAMRSPGQFEHALVRRAKRRSRPRRWRTAPSLRTTSRSI